MFLASNFCWEEIYARILSQNFAGKEFTRVSCSKTSLARNLRAYLAPKLRWQEIYARILSQNFAGKEFTRVSCSKSSLARNLRAYLAPNLRWEGIAARFLPQIFAGKVSRRDSCPKSSLGRCRGAILDMPPAAVETWRAASPSSYRAAAHTGRTRASRESASRGDVARRVSTSWTRKRRNPARPRGAAARERGRRSPAPPRRYRSILPPSEVTLATISSSPTRLWSPGMVFLRALAERAKSRHRWLSSPHLPRACM